MAAFKQLRGLSVLICRHDAMCLNLDTCASLKTNRCSEHCSAELVLLSVCRCTTFQYSSLQRTLIVQEEKQLARAMLWACHVFQ